MLNRLIGARVTCDPELPFQRLQIPCSIWFIFVHHGSGSYSHLVIIGGKPSHVKLFCGIEVSEAQKTSPIAPGGLGTATKNISLSRVSSYDFDFRGLNAGRLPVPTGCHEVCKLAQAAAQPATSHNRPCVQTALLYPVSLTGTLR